MHNTRRIVIVGATLAMAEHCARLWVKGRNLELTLIGRDSRRLERVATDLRIRGSQASIRVLEADFLDPVAIQATVDHLTAAGPVDLVLIAHGALPDQEQCQNDLGACHDALAINALSPVLYAEAFARHLAHNRRGTLALIGSVAGDRGRKSNYVYGAAKGLVTRYAQGLQHRFATTGVKIVLIKPGPTLTPMTARLQSQNLPFAPVEEVARQMVNAIERGQGITYIPGRWRLIMWVIRHLPAWAFHRMNL